MRRDDARRARIDAGAVVPARRLVSITGERIPIPDATRLVHLQFRRFAGCPVCNLHLQAFVRRHHEVVASSVREVVVFHSTVESLREFEGDLPFAVVADPGKRLYREFGVEASPRALLDPRAWPAIVRAVARSAWKVVREGRPVPPLYPEGGRYGLPADFLIGTDGRVIDCKYGVHADDHWSVDDVLDRARAARETREWRRRHSEQAG